MGSLGFGAVCSVFGVQGSRLRAEDGGGSKY